MEERFSEAPLQSAPIQESKSKNKLTVPLIFVSVLAVAGIGFGVYEYLLNNQAKQQISDLKEAKSIDNATTTTETGKIETEKDSEAITTDVDENNNGFVIQYMGIKIKNLENIATYSYKDVRRSAYGPGFPIATFTVGHNWGFPKMSDGSNLGTDSIPVVESATIYRYSLDSLFNHEKECDVEIGKIGEDNYCVKRLDYPEEYDKYSEDIKTAWVNWFNAGTDEIMEILSNPANYSAI